MELLERLESLDVKLFRFINREMVSLFCDAVMPTVTGTVLWTALAVIVVSTIRVKNKTNNIILFALVILACIGIADLLSFQIFKHLFSRLRPCYGLTDVRAIVGCGGNLGFPSNHATNSMTAFFFIFLVFRKWWTVAGFAVPMLIAFSRVYLGVHYPSDVLAGMILGIVVATTVYLFLRNNNRLSYLVNPEFILKMRKSHKDSHQSLKFSLVGEI